LQQLTASDAAAGARFGQSVAVSGNIAVIGAPGDSGSGAAYLFDVSTGLELAKLVATDAEGVEQFGVSVAVAGNLAVIGASEPGFGAGSAYLFSLSTHEQLMKFVAADGEFRDHLGTSVALDGDHVYAGAPGAGTYGAVYVFSAVPEPPSNSIALLGLVGFVGFRCLRRAQND
jgi:hypothetical protein